MADKILVLGVNGMLGHAVAKEMKDSFEVWGAVRDTDKIHASGLTDEMLGLKEGHLLGGVNAEDPSTARALIEQVKPDVVINCIGIVKQREAAEDAIPSIKVNSLWPHVLAFEAAKCGARLIHVSTDCVFSGEKGMYTESDVPDARDMYGRSKLLGEVTEAVNAVTIRTSIIGWQYGPQTSLIGWFAAHRDEELKGYTKAVFSGLSTPALARVMRDVVIPNKDLCGLYQVSAEPINKYDLLTKLAEKCGWNVDIKPDDSYVVDKSLDSSRFRELCDWQPESWDEMLQELADTYVPVS